MVDRDIDNVYIARLQSDIEVILIRFVELEDNDIVSIMEQEIHAKSSVFEGTSMSCWTSTVIEELFKHRPSFFIQDQLVFFEDQTQKI